MKWFLRIIAFSFVFIMLFLSAWYVLQGDIYFFTDIARDFLLLEELAIKKFVLIGPRSSTTGLFHGPLWMYLNLPAYILGGGNPVANGWFWISIICLFLASSFWIAKKLFNESTALLYVMLLAVFIVPEANGLYNPHGAFFLMPIFIYGLVNFVTLPSFKWATMVMIITGLITQFQLALGLPLAFLSAILIIFVSFKKKNLRPIGAIFFYLLPVVTFLLFEIRHDWSMTQSALRYALESKLANEYTSFVSLIRDRMLIMTGGGLGIFHNLIDSYSRIGFVIIGLFIFFQIRQKQFRNFYIIASFIYLGFHVLTVINRSGGMLYQYYMPLFPLVLLVISSTITSKWKYGLLPLVFIILLLYTKNSLLFIQSASTIIGKSEDSWKFNQKVAEDVVNQSETEFGYFIYSPDTYAYEQKYAMHYMTKQSNKNITESKKLPITYAIVAPPPPGNPNMQDEWWRFNKLKINKPPQTIKTYETGTRIDRFELTPEELSTPADPSIDLGIFFR